MYFVIVQIQICKLIHITMKLTSRIQIRFRFPRYSKSRITLLTQNGERPEVFQGSVLEFASFCNDPQMSGIHYTAAKSGCVVQFITKRGIFCPLNNCGTSLCYEYIFCLPLILIEIMYLKKLVETSPQVGPASISHTSFRSGLP